MLLLNVISVFYLLQSHTKGEVTTNKALTLFKLFTNFIIIIIIIIINILFNFIMMMMMMIIIIIIIWSSRFNGYQSHVHRVYTVTDENPSKEDFPMMALKTRHKFFYNSTKS